MGITAYRAGEYAEALRELRAAKRLTGSDDNLAMIADSERALGRPERALELVRDVPAGLDAASRVELLIVEAGARQDLGDPQAALRTLQIAELDVSPTAGRAEVRQARARLMSAYADALSTLGRDEEAHTWLSRAAEADLDGSTGAADRLGTAEDVDFFDLDEDGDTSDSDNEEGDTSDSDTTSGPTAQAEPAQGQDSGSAGDETAGGSR